MSCAFAHYDAAYVLGSLSPSERLAFETHLAECESCSRNVREFAGLPGLLSRVSPDVLETSHDPAPDSLLPSLTRQVRQLQRRRRLAVAGLAAAATVGVALGTAAVVNSIDNGSSPQAVPSVSIAPAVPMQPVGDADMTAEVSITTVPWGTRLDIACHYADDEYTNTHGSAPATFVLSIRTIEGTVEQVASWHAPEGGDMRLTAATAVPKDQIAAVWIGVEGGPIEVLLPT